MPAHTAVLARALAVSKGLSIMFHTSESTFTPDFATFPINLPAFFQNHAHSSTHLVSNLPKKLSFHSHLSSLALAMLPLIDRASGFVCNAGSCFSPIWYKNSSSQ
jgi:hypothetical protein